MSSSETVPCPFCEAEIGALAKKCRHCGEWVARSCLACGTPIRGEWAARGLCTECQSKQGKALSPRVTTTLVEPRSRGVAIALAVLLGGLGIHKFYLGRPGFGLAYLIFCWTFIPSLIGLCEGVYFAFMDDDEFRRRYSAMVEVV